MKVLNNIQFLRAFAAFNVVLFHLLGYTFSNTEFKGNVLNALSGWGQNGVDLFFVISGFIMVYVQNFKKRETKSFLLDRFVRIVPSYWFLIIMLAVVSFIFPSYFNTVVFNIKHILATMFFIFQPIYGTMPFVAVGWTLEYEMLFYLVFGISLLFTVQKKSLITTFLIILIISLVFKQYIIIEFLYGMLIGIIFLKYDLSKFGIYFLIFGIILLLASIGLNEAFSENYRMIIWGIPSSFIVLGSIYVKQIKSKFIKTIGDISYSTYLTHYLLIPIIYKIFTFAGITKYLNPLFNDFLAIIICCLIVFVSYIYFRIVEKPITNYLKKMIL